MLGSGYIVRPNIMCLHDKAHFRGKIEFDRLSLRDGASNIPYNANAINSKNLICFRKIHGSARCVGVKWQTPLPFRYIANANLGKSILIFCTLFAICITIFINEMGKPLTVELINLSIKRIR